jgi:hypothetical protein
MKTKIDFHVLTKKGNWFTVPLPHVREVCPRCEGEGKHVNPNIDGHGLMASDFDDPDFERSYFTGAYDVRCEQCEGEKVVWTLDWDSLSAKMQERVSLALDSNHRDDVEAAAERRIGA